MIRTGSDQSGTGTGHVSMFRRIGIMRAKIVLLASEGLGNDSIAARLSMPRQIVSKWRRRFYTQRLPGLDEQPRGGRPARFSPQRCGCDQGACL
jgi:transposase